MPTTQIQINTSYNATGAAAADVALGKVGATASKAERDLLAYANTVAKAQRTQGDAAGAVHTYEAALQQVDRTSKQAIATEGQLAASIAQVQRQAQSAPILPRTVESFGTEAIDQFKSGLLSIVGPAALVTAGIGAVKGAVDSFGTALHNVGQLQEERAAFDGIYGSINEGNATLDRAIVSTHDYGFTAKETTDAFKQLAPIIRDSTSSTNDQAGALERIAVLHPEDPANALARAIEGIRKGRFQEIAGEMGLTKNEAKALSDQVAHGTDAFIALNNALDKHGITLEVARDRMDGYAGAERRAQQAGEELQQAQAQFAQGPGLAILEEETRLVTGLSRVLGGSGGLAASFQAVNQNLKDSDLYQQVYNQSLENGATEAEADAAGLAALAQVQQASANAAQYAAAAYNSAAAAAGAVGRASGTAAVQVDSLTEALARGANPHQLPHINDSTVGAASGIGGLLEGGLGKLKSDVAQADQLGQVLFDNQLKRARDNAAKIALLRQRETGTSDPIERARIEGQIIDLQNQKGRVSAAASTGLQLQNIEENTQAELLKAQREGLERLRDQEQDFDLKRSRSKEDEDEKIRGLLARGQRAEAAREEADFAKRQRRDAEDFNIQRQRTIRNNNESNGDITGSAARKTDQLDARAALRGTRPVASGGASAPILSAPQAAATASSAPTVIQVNVGANVNLDSQQVGTLIFDAIHQRLDADLALELRSATPPGAGQSAVAGARP